MMDILIASGSLQSPTVVQAKHDGSPHFPPLPEHRVLYEGSVEAP